MPTSTKTSLGEMFNLGRVMIRPTFCICENKDADQLRGNREADQRLCFRYIDSTIPLLHKSKISSLQPSFVAAYPGLCLTRSETRMLVFSWRGSFVCFVTQPVLAIFSFKIKELCVNSNDTGHPTILISLHSAFALRTITLFISI